MSSELNNDNLKYTYKINVSKQLITFAVIILVGLVTSVMPLLLNNDQAIFYTSQSLYTAVILLFVTIMYFDWRGLIAGLITFIICGWVLKLPLGILLSNTIANILQLVLLLLSYKFIKTIKLENRNMYSTGNLYLNWYNFTLMLIFLVYLIYVFSSSEINIWVLLGFSLVVLCLTIIKSIKEKDGRLILYNVLIALCPSLIASITSYYLGTFFSETENTAIRYIFTWTLSNYIYDYSMLYLN